MSTLYEDYCKTNLLEHHLAVLQIKHYLHCQQSAIDSDNPDQFKQASTHIDKLINEYGIQALHQAENELL